jgi:hypothetical protein
MLLLFLLSILFIGKGTFAIQHWTERPKNGWKIFPGRGCGNLVPIKILDFMPLDTSSLTCTIVRKPLLSKETTPMAFTINGLVTTTKGNKTKVFHNWGEKFCVTFEIEVNQEFTATWLNVFHMTIGGNMGKHGDRIPALFVNKAKFFHFTMSIGDKNNYVWNFNYQLDKTYSVEIMQKPVAGKFEYCIEIDGQSSHCIENTTPRSFDSVQLYLSGPWGETFSKFGKLWNFSVSYL